MNKKAIILAVSVLGCAVAHAAVVASFNEGYDGITGSTGADLVSSSIPWGGDLSGQKQNTAGVLSWDGRAYGLAASANTGNFQGDYDFYFGDSVYGDLTTVANNRDSRYRIRNANPDVFQLLSEGGTASLERAGLMMLDGVDTALGNINQMTAGFMDDFNVSVVVEVGGTLYVTSSSQERSAAYASYALDLENETWQLYAPGTLTDDAATDYDLDFRFASAKGAVFALDSSDTVTKIGLAYETTSGAADGKAWSSNSLVFDTIPEPATLGLVAAMGSGILFIRRRFVI